MCKLKIIKKSQQKGRHDIKEMFGFPSLRRPADCERIATAAALRCRILASRVAGGVHFPAASVLRDLDLLSSTVCRVLDTLQLARNVHPDPSFVAAAGGAYDQLGSTLRELNTDSRLHGAVCAVLDTPAVASGLGQEELRFAQAMRAEFEHDGAHMSSGKRSTLQMLQATADSKAWAFEAGISERGAGVWISEEAVATLPAALSAILPRCVAYIHGAGSP